MIDENIDSIDHYGFSSEGGTLVNIIRLLNIPTYDPKIKEIEVGALEKEKILTAIQKGRVILDTPFKFIEEIIDFRGSTKEFEILAKNYQNNNLRPIDSLLWLKRLSLNILLHFQEKDEILSNRTVIIENDGGHMATHSSLWQAYLQKINQLDQDQERSS